MLKAQNSFSLILGKLDIQNLGQIQTLSFLSLVLLILLICSVTFIHNYLFVFVFICAHYESVLYNYKINK